MIFQVDILREPIQSVAVTLYDLLGFRKRDDFVQVNVDRVLLEIDPEVLVCSNAHP